MWLAILCLLSVLLQSVANAEARIALLIGNQRYIAKVGPLNNPHSDVLLVGAALKAVGFTIAEVKDADYRSADAAIKRHIAAVRGAWCGGSRHQDQLFDPYRRRQRR
jgi:hypothetical protein